MELISQYFQLEQRCIVLPEIKEFADSRNMLVTQENKYRVLRHKSNPQSDPLRGGHELIIGGLPRDCFEPELVPHLESFGRIYEFRLAMVSSWENRGYAFVKFCDPNVTKLAQMLNNFLIRPGRQLQVSKWIANCNLLLIGLPFNKSVTDIFEELSRISPGLESVGVAKGGNNQLALAKGFGQLVIATYLNQELTTIARNQLVSSHLCMWGERIHVEWAVQKPNSSDFPRVFLPNQCLSTLHKSYCCSRILHVLGLSPDISNTQLYKIFDEQSNDGVNYMLRYQDQAFIFFKSQDQADMAKGRIHATLVNGNFLYVDVFRTTVSSSWDELLAMEAGRCSVPEAPEKFDANLGDKAAPIA